MHILLASNAQPPNHCRLCACGQKNGNSYESQLDSIWSLLNNTADVTIDSQTFAANLRTVDTAHVIEISDANALALFETLFATNDNIMSKQELQRLLAGFDTLIAADGEDAFLEPQDYVSLNDLHTCQSIMKRIVDQLLANKNSNSDNNNTNSNGNENENGNNISELLALLAAAAVEPTELFNVNEWILSSNIGQAKILTDQAIEYLNQLLDRETFEMELVVFCCCALSFSFSLLLMMRMMWLMVVVCWYTTQQQQREIKKANGCTVAIVM